MNIFGYNFGDFLTNFFTFSVPGLQQSFKKIYYTF